MEKKSRKQIIIGLMALLLVSIMLLGLSYAYYRTRIVNNSATKSVITSSGKIEISYLNESEYINLDNIEPGYTNEDSPKTFTVKNTGDKTASFSIILDKMESTFLRKKDWTYTLKDGNTIIKSGILPQTTSYISFSEELESGETKEYSLIINYVNSAEDQSIDMGKRLSFRINISNEVGGVFKSATEGTLLKAIGNDNIISESLTIPGQQASAKHVYSEDNTTNVIETMNMSSGDPYWVYGTGYEFDEVTEQYNLTGVKIGLYEDIYNDLEGKYLISSSAAGNSHITQYKASKLTTTNLSKVYEVVSSNYDTSGNKELTYKIHEVINSSDISESELAKTSGNGGDTYYFRGAVENNYVTYSGMCWRIVRVMENGDIKLALADRDNACGTANGYSVDDIDGASIVDPTTQKFIFNNVIYKESNIVHVLNAWAGIDESRDYNYNDPNNNMNVKSSTFTNSALDLTKLSATPNWCVDTTYGAYNRLNNLSTAAPTLKCPSSLDDESKIGVLSADEVVFAGATVYQNVMNFNYYLMTNLSNVSYWSLSPISGNSLWIVSSNGYIASEGSISYNFYSAIRPAVVLRSDVLLSAETDYTQDGTIDKPYVIG